MLTYTGVTPAGFAALEASLLSHGLKASGNFGMVKKLGAVIAYNYTPARQILTIDVMHAPWTVKLAGFTRTVDAAVQAALQDHNGQPRQG